MRKKSDVGLYFVYAVYDKISKRFRELYFNTTDEDFIRLRLPQIILEVPLRDLEVYKIGTFDVITGEFKNTTKKKIDIYKYCFPHSRLSPVGENISHEEIEKTVNETKNEIISNLKESEVKENE